MTPNHVIKTKFVEILDDDNFCLNPFGICTSLNIDDPQNPQCDEFNKPVKIKQANTKNGIVTDYLKCVVCLVIFQDKK